MPIRLYQITFYLFLICFASCVWASSHHSERLVGMRVSATNTTSRLVFDLTGPVKYHTFFLKKPNRLVLDLAATHLATNLNHPSLLNTQVKDIRASSSASASLPPSFHSGATSRRDKPAKLTLRLVFDLKAAVTYKAFTLQTPGSRKIRLVIDLKTTFGHTQQKKKPVAKLKATSRHTSKSQVDKNEASAFPPVIGANGKKQVISHHHKIKKSSSKMAKTGSQVAVRLTKPKQLRDVIIVIDPGHGGYDSGATGYAGIKEKDVVLAIARYLQLYLNQYYGIRALLTRTGDYFISLRDRLHIAHVDEADMFIAIHADAYNNPYSHGASVFALSPRGATSELARWLAEKENRSELGHVIKDKNLMLKSVLIDLSQTLTIDNSLAIGNDLLSNLGQLSRLHSHKVEQAAFVVLKSPDIPSLLIETGFISNPYEARHLRDTSYQRKIAYALAQGIKNYFTRHPPRGTYLSARLLQ